MFLLRLSEREIFEWQAESSLFITRLVGLGSESMSAPSSGGWLFWQVFVIEFFEDIVEEFGVFCCVRNKPS
jgi:hypothetical protein